jgi:hypothetical protein
MPPMVSFVKLALQRKTNFIRRGGKLRSDISPESLLSQD